MAGRSSGETVRRRAPHPRRAACAIVLAVALLIPPAGARAEPQPYVFDKDHTSITFSWDHLGLSRQGGRVLQHQGTLELDLESPEASRVDITMKAASLWTGVEALDRHLRSPDFFHAARHPDIAFKSTAVRKTGERAGEIDGDLTILGVTKQVTLSVTLNFSGEHPLAKINPAYKDLAAVGFSATAKLKRSDWGLQRGAPLISDEVRIAIEAELTRRPAP